MRASGSPGKLLGGWCRAALHAMLPSACALCGGRAMEAVCAACAAAYIIARPRCPCCANPAAAPDADRRCGACLANPPAFDATLVACDYALPLDGLVLQLKFGAQLALAPWMGQVLVDALRSAPAALPDLLCPVPLGPRRLVERGFNQALEVARPLARALDVPLAPRLLTRERDTAAQSGVEAGARRKNVRGAFGVSGDAAAFAGRHVGVVDDVMSSGHTLDEIAAVLKRAGAARVTNIVFARTPPHA